MIEATFTFPRGFMWGTATSSHQVEGNNINNNWWKWEHEEERIIHGQKSGLACDWWGGRWREDFDRAAESNQNAHRLSIEWSRVQPTPDRWDEDALDHYRQMLRGLVERNLTPIVTLHHFSDPLWLDEMGGWETDSAVGAFQDYVQRVVTALKEYVNIWCTINEPNVLAYLGYLAGEFPPGKKDMRLTFNVMEILLRAHAAGYHAIHEVQPEARVGMVVNYRGFHPAKQRSPLDRFISRFLSRTYNDFFPHAAKTGELRLPGRRTRATKVKGTQDFLGINYYTQDLVAFDLRLSEEAFGRRSFPPDAELSETGFIANSPEGFYDALKWGLQFDVPMIVTENGVEDSHDDFRRRYMIQHIHQMWRGVNFNWPIKGYFYWTLVDNFEWERGWTQRFGLWALDVDTQARIKRPSVDLYAEICRENALSSKMVERYSPEIYSILFPE